MESTGSLLGGPKWDSGILRACFLGTQSSTRAIGSEDGFPNQGLAPTATLPHLYSSTRQSHGWGLYRIQADMDEDQLMVPSSSCAPFLSPLPSAQACFTQSRA